MHPFQEFISNSSFTDWIQTALTCTIGAIAYAQWRTYVDQSETMKVQAELTRQTIEQGQQANATAFKSLELSQDTTKRQLRAYIALESAAFESSPLIRPSNLLVSFKNYGATPAYSVKFAGCVHTITQQELELLSIEEESFESKGTLPPNESGVNAEYINFPDEVRQNLRDNNLKLFVYGEVRYIDIFGEPHKTKYRLIPNHKPMLGQFVLVPDTDGNEAT
jgi:hypothetical protein